jgi:hypothetical protein
MARAYIEYLPPAPVPRDIAKCYPPSPAKPKDGIAAVCQGCNHKFVLTWYSGNPELMISGNYYWNKVHWYSWWRRRKFNKAYNAR